MNRGRRLSPHETLRLMGIRPDNYKWEYKPSHIRRMAGNAMCVSIMTQILSCMFHTPSQQIPVQSEAFNTSADRGIVEDDDPSSNRVSELLTRLMSAGPKSGELANPAAVLEDEMLEAKRHALWYGGRDRIDHAVE